MERLRDVLWRRLAGFALSVTLLASAQNNTVAARHKTDDESKPPPKPASLEGIVLGDDTGRPLRRAEVTLHPAEARLHGYTQATDEKGHFSFPEILPGGYTIDIQRDGYLPSAVLRVSGTRLPHIFTLGDSSHYNDAVIRMQPWGVIAGKVKFDDGEPAINAEVQLYREYFYRNRHGYKVTSGGRTNDLGEYRIHGLMPGTYYVAAVHHRPVVPGAEEPQLKDRNGQLQPELRYAVTFFPSATKMTDAVPVRLARSEELRVVDIFLTAVPTIRVQGKVLSGVSGRAVSGPAIVLRRADANDTASVNAPVDLEADREDGFILKGVVPGSYLITMDHSEDGKPLYARQLVSFAQTGQENLSVVLKPPALWKGMVRIEGDDSINPSTLRVELQPRRESASTVAAAVENNGEFSLGFIPDEPYDLVVKGGPPDLYLKSARLGNVDILWQGVRAGSGEEPARLNLVMAKDGGVLAGRVFTPENAIASGATVVLIPDPPAGRVQFFQTTDADENGFFSMQGIPPGHYVLVSWFDDPPCEIYDPDASAACRSAGKPVDFVTQGQVAVEIRTAPQ